MANQGDFFFNFIAADILNKARQQAGKEAFAAIKIAIDGLERAVKSRPKTIENLYRKVAQQAQDVMVDAYEARPNQTRMSGTGYRNDDMYVGPSGRPSRRYGGGLLGAALASPEMYHITPHGIEFINKAHLDKSARQWYRLNFGVGKRGGETPPAPHFQMTIMGQTLPGDIGLFEFQRRPGSFVLPSGWWSSEWPPSKASKQKYSKSARGQDAFIRRGYGSVRPGGYGKRRMSLGIQGSRFLDAGMGALVHGFPRAIEDMVAGWFKEAAANTPKGPLKVTVKVSPKAITAASTFVDDIRSRR